MKKFSDLRRTVLKGAALSMLALMGTAAISNAQTSSTQEKVDTSPQKTPVVGSKKVTSSDVKGSVAKVYFSPVIDSASLIKLYNLVNDGIYGILKRLKVAVVFYL